MNAIPWYKSAIVRQAALAILIHIIGFTPLAKYLAGVDLAPLVDGLLEALGTYLDASILHTRITKPIPPVALTKAKADAANLPSEIPK